MLGNTVRLRFVYVPIKEKRKTFRFTGFWLKGSECSAPEKKKYISVIHIIKVIDHKSAILTFF